jgi:hypothetical protein
MAGSCHRTQAGTSDSSCTVVSVTPGLATLKDAAKDSSDGKYEEEVELHDVLTCDTWGSDSESALRLEGRDGMIEGRISFPLSRLHHPDSFRRYKSLAQP